MPEITVAITAYNLEKYLSHCFEQLISQTYQNFEILIYDDCSCDATRDILDLYKNKLGNKLQIILGQTPLRLPAESRNAILDSGMIQGEYVVFLDGDDIIERTFLEKLYNAVIKSSADISVCAYNRFESETGHVLCTEMQGYPRQVEVGKTNYPSLAFVNTSLWNKLIKVSRIGQLRFPSFSVGEDACFLLSVYNNCNKICFIDDILIHYRVRANSVISNTSESTIYAFAEELFKLWKASENTFLKNDIALASFIHIGISMAIRANNGCNVDSKKIIHWISAYFQNNYGWFTSCIYLRFFYLIKYGFKGLCIWIARICYRLGVFSAVLFVYSVLIRITKKDFKF